MSNRYEQRDKADGFSGHRAADRNCRYKQIVNWLISYYDVLKKQEEKDFKQTVFVFTDGNGQYIFFKSKVPSRGVKSLSVFVSSCHVGLRIPFPSQ